MFGKLPAEIAGRTDLAPSAKVIYALLQMHHNPDTGQCNPSQATLARECGVTQSTASRHLKKLFNEGLIELNDGNYTFPDYAPLHTDHAPVHIGLYKDRKEKEKESTGSDPKPESNTNATSRRLLGEWDARFPATNEGRGSQHGLYDQNALEQLLKQGATEAQIRAVYAYIEQHDQTKYYWRPYRLLKRIDQGRGPTGYQHLTGQIEAAKRKAQTPMRRRNRGGTPMADMAERVLARRRARRAIATG